MRVRRGLHSDGLRQRDFQFAGSLSGRAICRAAASAAYDGVRSHFSDKEVVDLTWAAAAINTWNRVVIASRAEAGSYRPGQ